MAARRNRESLMVPTRKLPRIAYFWPGLPQLWLRGSWAGLVIAVGFSALVNVLILGTCVFHEWIPREQMLGGSGLVAVSWLVGWWQYRRQTVDESAARVVASESSGTTVAVGLASEPREQLFREAQQVYLRGDWVAAEQKLLKLLKLDDRDAEARLMLATLWRHQGRYREAVRQLEKLSRLEVADAWLHEIAVEREENAAALAEAINDSKECRLSTEPNDAATPVGTTRVSEEPETHNIASAEPLAAENQETNRRWAA
jgi:hypothetical protein